MVCKSVTNNMNMYRTHSCGGQKMLLQISPPHNRTDHCMEDYLIANAPAVCVCPGGGGVKVLLKNTHKP